MWLFTRYGFFSVSAQGRNGLTVRARALKHLEGLKKNFLILQPYSILTLKQTDYRYRMVVPRDVWALVLVKLSQEQTWSNIKSECGKFSRDPIYIAAMHDVWDRVFLAGQEWELNEWRKK